MRRQTLDQKVLGDEPVLDEKSSVSDYIRAYNWYNYNHDNDDAKKFVITFLKGKKVSDTILKKVGMIEPIKLRTIGWQCRILSNGGFIDKSDTKKMLDKLHSLIESVVLPVQKVVDTNDNVISIQDRIKNRASDLIGDLEEVLDTLILKGHIDLDLTVWFRENNVKPQVAKLIKNYYEPIYAECVDDFKSTDPEIKDAYKHLSKPLRKKYLGLLKEILALSDAQSIVIKTTRKPRKKKIKPAAVIVSKLKYKQKSGNIESIKPTEIVDAIQVWTYNDKTKILSVFNALGKGLSVKGSTIIGFDEKLSVSKTLRKPDVTLPRVIEGGKVALKKLMSELKTKEKKAKGRINNDTLIIRAIK